MNLIKEEQFIQKFLKLGYSRLDSVYVYGMLLDKQYTIVSTTYGDGFLIYRNKTLVYTFMLPYKQLFHTCYKHKVSRL